MIVWGSMFGMKVLGRGRVGGYVLLRMVVGLLEGTV